MPRPPDPLVGDGILVVAKEAGWTSHDVVGRIRRIAGTRKVGHAGTLDPMATGVLVIGVNRGTRLLTYLVGCDKTYTATIRLGIDTRTDDAEGEITATRGAGGLGEADVAAGVRTLTGPIQQVPSAVSAIKVDGQRSYARVRAGEAVALAARPVTVHSFDIDALRPGVAVVPTEQPTLPPTQPPAQVPILDVDVSVDVSAGTYVRALARDLGQALGCGGHLTALRRTRVGSFTIDQAHPVADLAALREAAAAGTSGLPLIAMADAAREVLPVRVVSDPEAIALGHGKALPPTGPAGLAAAVSGDGRLVAILDQDARAARPVTVFTAQPPP